MTDALRISVDELRKRMEEGEDFVLVDTRNPQQWAKSDVKLPEAIRVPVDKLDDALSGIPTEKPIITYCT
jgi:rhodanese-related sulfurtransferase